MKQKKLTKRQIKNLVDKMNSIIIASLVGTIILSSIINSKKRKKKKKGESQR